MMLTAHARFPSWADALPLYPYSKTLLMQMTLVYHAFSTPRQKLPTIKDPCPQKQPGLVQSTQANYKCGKRSY